MIVEIKDLRINMKAREWCKLSYPDHPKGCPNYGKRDNCPPNAPLINEYYDLDEPLYLISVGFDLEEHIKKMLSIHSHWTMKQAKCVLYWQNTVRKNLKQVCQQFISEHPMYSFNDCPEAMGVNVIATAQNCGIPIKVQPEKIVYKIAFAGVPNGRGNNTRTDKLLSTQMSLL